MEETIDEQLNLDIYTQVFGRCVHDWSSTKGKFLRFKCAGCGQKDWFERPPNVPPFSTDIAQAWLVIKKMQTMRTNHPVKFELDIADVFGVRILQRNITSFSNSCDAARAICETAITTVQDKKTK